MAILNVMIGKNRLMKVQAKVRNISEAQEAGSLFQKVGLALRLLNDSIREEATEPTAPLPIGTTDLFACACGATFYSTSAAITHVESHHASSTIRRDLDRLEDTIECLISPSPLPPVSEEILPTRTWGDELTNEIASILANYGVGQEPDGSEPNEEHFDRARKLMRTTRWRELKDLTYLDIKRQIIDQGPNAPRIPRPLHEDFLTAIGIFTIQVKQADQ
jgi:hypothetical protein